MTATPTTRPDPDQPTLPPGPLRFITPMLFVGVVTVVGAGAAAISFAVSGRNPSVDPSLRLPALWPPDWVFWAVWLVIYPASGVATWRLRQRRKSADVRGAGCCPT